MNISSTKSRGGGCSGETKVRKSSGIVISVLCITGSKFITMFKRRLYINKVWQTSTTRGHTTECRRFAQFLCQSSPYKHPVITLVAMIPHYPMSRHSPELAHIGVDPGQPLSGASLSPADHPHQELPAPLGHGQWAPTVPLIPVLV